MQATQVKKKKKSIWRRCLTEPCDTANFSQFRLASLIIRTLCFSCFFCHAKLQKLVVRLWQQIDYIQCGLVSWGATGLIFPLHIRHYNNVWWRLLINDVSEILACGRVWMCMHTSTHSFPVFPPAYISGFSGQALPWFNPFRKTAELWKGALLTVSVTQMANWMKNCWFYWPIIMDFIIK